jgi:hypothetical protein
MVALVQSLGACYAYRPVDSAPIGASVRVHIPVQAAVDVPGRQPETVTVEGTVLELGDSLSLATETRREFGAYRELVQFDTLRLGASQVARIELKEFSQGRSIGLGLAISAVVAAAAAVAFGVGGGSAGDGPPGGGGPQGAFVINPAILTGLLGALSGGR